MVARRAALAVAVCACSGKPHPDEVTPVVVARDAAPGRAADGAVGAPGDAGATGDLQLRVEWPRVPVVARSSPGRTPCNTPRAPSVAPTTTWGIPDALVVVEGTAPAGPTEARVTLADCALTPRLVVGTTLVLTSAVDRPARVILRKRGPLAQLVAGEPIAIALPIAGHTVTVALDAGAIYALETDAPEPEVAFVAAIPGAAVTEATGQVTLHDLAPGAHAVTAWLPPRAGQPARTGHASARITAGDLVELTVPLAP